MSGAKEYSVLVRRAVDSEARACRLLMPETFSPHFAPDLWLAVEPSGRLAGVAAVAWRPLMQISGFPIQVHVLPAFRRRGVGTALIEAVADACATAARNLHGWASEPEDSIAAAFATAVGFKPRKRLLGFEADGPRFYAMIKAIHGRMSRAGKIPPEFRIVPLREAPMDEVASLVAGSFPDVPVTTALAIARGLVGYDALRSAVLLDRGQVKGALLYNWNDGDPVIDVNVVAPELRLGPANLMLLEAATRNGLEGGAVRFRFQCEESARDTMNLARRSGAKPTGVRIAFIRPLPIPG